MFVLLLLTPPRLSTLLHLLVVNSTSTPVTPAEVSEMVRALPGKQCLSDPMPTHVLKLSVDILAPFLSRLFCLSLEHGVIPLKMKAAHIMPTLKKADLDPAEAKSYRPISNLSVLSKLLERLVAKQLVTYLRDNSLLPDRQSAYLSLIHI